MIVIEELEGSEAKEGKRRGSSTSIFSSILPPTEVVIVDVGPEIKKRGRVLNYELIKYMRI